ADGEDVAMGIAVSPQGTTVFVTGWSAGTGTALDYATIAYTARNLLQMWVSRYDGPGHHGDQAVAIAMTPDGRAVEVTGFSGGARCGFRNGLLQGLIPRSALAAVIRPSSGTVGSPQTARA